MDGRGPARARGRPMNEASQRQIAAADPARSTWLSANAGSGKTRVLTDRVARLLLGGAPPQTILCLTYTKAAATEMQNRLFQRLGGWAMLPDARLRAELAALGVDDVTAPDTLARARRLFARAIETPGGLKIQTIHSFCAALLRRFPLEAGVPPQVVELDDRTTAQIVDACIEELAEVDPDGCVSDLAQHYTGEDFVALSRAVIGQRDLFDRGHDDAALARTLGVPKDGAAPALGPEDRDLLAQMVAAMDAHGTATDRAQAPILAKARDLPAAEAQIALESCLLTTKFVPKTGKYPNKAARAALGPAADEVDTLIERVAEAREGRLALAAWERTVALHRYARHLLPTYAAHKTARGGVDFDDLILKARDLLTDSAVASWVLYRLDGAISHILVDEAQDTSPTQWEVVAALAAEFAAGEGTHAAGERTLFVVGDKKQSIYSFQGADPEAFDRMQAVFAAQMEGAAPLFRTELLHSFRSSRAILSTVDRVFDGPAGVGLGRDVRHLAFHGTLPGRVDLWPVVAKEATDTDDVPWFAPVDLVAPGDPTVRLAEAVAGEIDAMIRRGDALPRPDGTPRPVGAGDILILVRSRKALFFEIIRACKARGLEIAGADRMILTAELAVRDIVALLSFLDTPEDDLSLAAVLRSPLCGLTEAQVFDLAADRPERFLWQVLRRRRADFAGVTDMLDDLRAAADYLRPFELIERLLTRHGGRVRLTARLGAEAEDAIDELMTQAMAYERTEVPSLTGFLSWLSARDVEVKRQAAGRGRAIRVMTVHGAKGLEAPVVILPDTTSPPRPGSSEILVAEGVPLWRTRAAEMPTAMTAAKGAADAADAAERARLLYVAMTRAETWLIVAGAGDPARLRNTWYRAVEEAMEGAAAPLVTPVGPGLRIETGAWPDAADAPADAGAAAQIALPAWVDRPPPPDTAPPPPLSPSDLGGAKVLPDESADAALAEAATRRGTALHRLLERLPSLARDTWAARGARMLAEDGIVPAEDAAALVDEAARLIGTPALAPLFGADSLAEVDIAGPLAALGGRIVAGTVDRLLIAPDRVMAVDFKSNRRVPVGPQDVPEGVLRQMGAYAALLAAVYPGRVVDTAILWTRTATLMPLPSALTDAALRRAAPA
ncbi:double-strand break repair helicase AddA [Rhodobacteraceae bacterium CCMM004]|nr:double-strand break repair helicase AddA [Rhodobacteraceae bacterium CCMM004]